MYLNINSTIEYVLLTKESFCEKRVDEVYLERLFQISTFASTNYSVMKCNYVTLNMYLGYNVISRSFCLSCYTRDSLLRPDHGAPINTLKCVGEAMGTAQPVGGVHA